MINFSYKDYNISNIVEETNLLDKNLWGEYRIYGFKEIGEKEIIISYDADTYSTLDKNLWRLTELFVFTNNLKINYKIGEEEKDIHICKIGLRKDLRANVKLCSCIVQTIVGVAENKLINLNVNFKFKK